MKNQYFLKDKKALIYVSTQLCLPGDMPKTYYIPRTPAPIWAYASQLKQDIIFEAKKYGEEESYMFVFNRHTRAKLYDYILYRDKWYIITRIDTKADYNTDVFIYAKDAPEGRIPDENNLRPYGWQRDY